MKNKSITIKSTDISEFNKAVIDNIQLFSQKNDFTVKSDNCYLEFNKHMNNINVICNIEPENITEILFFTKPYFDIDVNKINIYINLDREYNCKINIINKKIILFYMNNDKILIEYKDFEGEICDSKEYRKYSDKSFNIKNKGKTESLINIYYEEPKILNRELNLLLSKIIDGIRHILEKNLPEKIDDYTYNNFRIAKIISPVIKDIEFFKITKFHYDNILKEQVFKMRFEDIKKSPVKGIDNIVTTPNSFAVEMKECKNITSEKIWEIFNTFKLYISGEHLYINFNEDTSIVRMDGEIHIKLKKITKDDKNLALLNSDEVWGIPVILNDKFIAFEGKIKKTQ